MYLSTSKSIFCRMNEALNSRWFVSDVNKNTVYSYLHECAYASILLHDYKACLWALFRHACININSGAHTFLALPKPFSRARVWASPSEPSCSWTRAWLVKMSSSPAADISTSALSSERTTSLKNKRIVCVSLSVLCVSERCQTEIASARLVRTHLCPQSSVHECVWVWVWDPICMFSLPLINNSSA